jgi:hypothetical protein
MQSITKTYLIDTIYRMINTSIRLHRQSKNNSHYNEVYPVATDEEMIDFIVTIPYFDIDLKDFLLGNVKEETVIISQSWEIEFIKKCTAWANSYEWLEGDEYYLSDAHISSLMRQADCLSLPY